MRKTNLSISIMCNGLVEYLRSKYRIFPFSVISSFLKKTNSISAFLLLTH